MLDDNNLRMKKVFMTFAAVLCIAMTAMVSFSCSDKDEFQNSVEEEMTDTDPVDNTPTTDAMATKTNAKAYVFEGDYGNIGKKVLSRISNRQSEIDSTTELIFIPAEKFSALSQEVKNSITVAYKHGAKILVDRPSASEMILMAFSIPDGFALTTIPESKPNDEVLEMWGFNLSSDVLGMDIPVNDSTDTSSANRAVLTDYEEGLFADEATEWVNTDQNVVAQTRMAGAATRTNTELSSILDAQTDTWICSMSTDYFEKLKNKQTPYVVFTTIYAVHKFSTDTDYFLIDQTITGNNNTFWMNEWKQKNYKADNDGKKHDWKMQGFYANNWEVNNWVTTKGWKDSVTINDGLRLTKHAPASTNASTTTSTSTSWNLSGELGNSGGSFTGGISGSVGSSQTMMDISTVDKCMNDDTRNNARWEYTIDPWRQIKENTFTYSFIEPPKAAIETFTSEQSWLWELQNASQYKELYMRSDFVFQLYRTLIRSGNISCRYEGCGKTGWLHFIKINLPKRTK